MKPNLFPPPQSFHSTGEKPRNESRVAPFDHFIFTKILKGMHIISFPNEFSIFKAIRAVEVTDGLISVGSSTFFISFQWHPTRLTNFIRSVHTEMKVRRKGDEGMKG
jgi:hypothetical protein